MSYYERIDTAITNEAGDEFVKVTNGGLDVNIQDQHSQTINLLLARVVQVVTVATAAAIDDMVITLTAAVSPVVGNLICLKEEKSFYQGFIMAVVANGSNWDVTLDTPLDYAFTTAGGCSERNSNMAVDGSVTPVEFSVSPGDLQDGVQWDITRILATITSGTAMDDAKFGGIPALTRGIYMRHVNGITKNLFNIKSNQDWRLEAFDVNYSTKAPAGSYGFSIRRTYGGQSKSGVTLRLDAISSDKLSVWVQDDLTGDDTFFMRVQGHEVE